MLKTIHITDLSLEQIQLKQEQRNQSKWLPGYHISPPFGLLNDPNGLYYENGTYQLYFQWYPGGPTHGLKHWLHLSSKNLKSFEFNGLGIKPGKDYDLGGAFSGSAVEIAGQRKIIYTSNNLENGIIMQRQLLADIEDNEVVNKRLLIENDNYMPHQFRDPTTYNNGDSTYIIVGAQTLDGTPGIAHYQYAGDKVIDLGILHAKVETICQMIECPQIIDFQAEKLFISSPQGIERDGNNYQNHFNVVYSTFDKINYEEGSLVNESSLHELDYGHDFYAPQIFEAENQKILIAWAGCGKSKYPEQEEGWMNILTMPRVLKLKDSHLYQYPHQSIRALTHKYTKVNEGRYQIDSTKFTIKFNCEENCAFEFTNGSDVLRLERKGDNLILDRSNTKNQIESLHGDVRVAKIKNSIVEIFIDNSIIEVFYNDYQNTMTSRFYVENLSIINSTCNYELALVDEIELTYEGRSFE